jgi:hypothetical protein
MKRSQAQPLPIFGGESFKKTRFRQFLATSCDNLSGMLRQTASVSIPLCIGVLGGAA